MLPFVRTDMIKVNAVHPEAAIIEQAALLLRAGELVGFPTETVYGLGADAMQSTAVERIFEAKGRPFSDPLIVHIAAFEDLAVVSTAVSARAARLAEAFWPGPLTLILPRGPRVPSRVTAGLETVAVRMPRHPVALALIRALGSPIAAPSANRFMHVSPTTAQHVLADLGGRVPLILDGGPCDVGVESTIVDLSADPPIILRPGGVSLEALRAVTPEIQPPRRAVEAPFPGETEKDAQVAPGQFLVHYAPAVPLLLFNGAQEAMRAAMLTEIQRHHERGERIGVLVADEDRAAFRDSNVVLQSPGSETRPEQIAGALFACLRALEEAGAQVILCRNFDDRGLGLAIRDRLLKAAGGKIIEV